MSLQLLLVVVWSGVLALVCGVIWRRRRRDARLEELRQHERLRHLAATEYAAQRDRRGDSHGMEDGSDEDVAARSHHEVRARESAGAVSLVWVHVRSAVRQRLRLGRSDADPLHRMCTA